MHDLDRTQLEFESGQETGEYEEEWGHEAGEYEEEQSEGFLGGILGGLLGGEMEAPAQEMQELELASELLEVASEEELEGFLGDLVKSAASGIGRVIRSDAGRQLTGILRQAAKTALPVVGGAIGQWASPGSGRAIGQRMATAAGDLMGLELEGLSSQEQEFEAARQFVRFASAAGKRAATAPHTVPPRAVAQRSAAWAAQRHAPGLLHPRRTAWLNAAPARSAPYRPGQHRAPRPGYPAVAGYDGAAAPFRRRRHRSRPYRGGYAPRYMRVPRSRAGCLGARRRRRLRTRPERGVRTGARRRTNAVGPLDAARPGDRRPRRRLIHPQKED